ncbi:hypothetical protein BH09PSE4_BH09PSE4_15820 [soil metagenome]
MIRRHFLRSAGAASLGLAAGRLPARAPDVDWAALAADVRAEMKWAWGEYRKYAWGQDEMRPVSATGQSFLIEGQTVGLSIVEALDTLWLMGLDAELEDGVRWIKQHLTFDLDGDAQLFEASIRLVGGLLSGHLATGEARLLELAHDLATRMMPGFDTPTGMPMRYVHLRTGATRDAISFPAEIGGFSPEYATLSRLTGEKRFTEAANRAMLSLYERRSKIDLIADKIDVTTGAWASRRATIGPPTDSYFEYLWDIWRLTGDVRFRDAYRTCTAAILRHMPVRQGGRLWFTSVDFETGARISNRQSELSAFYAGLLGESGDVAAARGNMAAWKAAQDRFGVLPEAFDADNWAILAKTNALRPEVADAAFNLWLGDRGSEWRQIVRTHYLTMKARNRAPHGYSGLSDVSASPPAFDDACPGYWWSEQMKYYYLAFADCPRFDYRDNYLSTEGNVLKGMRR